MLLSFISSLIPIYLKVTLGAEWLNIS